MLNKCFLSGYIHSVKDKIGRRYNEKYKKNFFLFDLEVEDVLKNWTGIKKYQTIRCLAPAYIMKEPKKLINSKNKGVILIEGHLGYPNEERVLYVIVDKISPTIIKMSSDLEV